MKIYTFTYLYKEKEYNVYVKKQFQRNIYFRLKDDGFHVSCPYLTSKEEIIRGLNKFSGKLIQHYDNRNSNYSFEENFVYILGEKYELSSLNIDDEDQLNRFLKKVAIDEIAPMVRVQEKIMGISNPYRVSIRKTVAQFGSNSKTTRTLSFQQNLIHYSKEIINSVVVHELAHEFYRNHQEGFYEVVFKYCPDYKLVQKKLKKGIHK